MPPPASPPPSTPPSPASGPSSSGSHATAAIYTVPTRTEEPRKVYAVDWKSVFPALHLLRAFRIALHPSKLMLGLTFVLLVYSIGRLLDAIWLRKYRHELIPAARPYLPSSMVGEASDQKLSGPFDVLLKWELGQLHDLTSAVWNLSVTGGLQALGGFVIAGPIWLFTKHPFFAILFAIATLLCWAIFGGAIARIAAVHVTRDEKISVRNALRFSVGKLLSFVFAPLILCMFVLLAGLAIAASTLLMYIPWAGPVLVGLLFIFVLLIGFVITLTLLGSLGGSGLMYPTIAVEGSDAFDAISTSFSYFFAKPLRLFAYSFLALVYGALSYILVKGFVFVMFYLIHAFQGWFLTEGTFDKPGMLPKFNEFFPTPDMDKLSYDLNYTEIGSQLGTGGKIGASIISFWFYLLVGLLGAYALSFYFSASTIIYTLLRHDVERTEMDDVYLETEDEEGLADQALPDAPVSSGSNVPPTPGPVGAPPPTA